MHNAIEHDGEILPKYEGPNAPYFIDEAGNRYTEQSEVGAGDVEIDLLLTSPKETLIGEPQEVAEEWLAMRAAAKEAAARATKPNGRQQRENAQRERAAHYRRTVKQIRA